MYCRRVFVHHTFENSSKKTEIISSNFIREINPAGEVELINDTPVTLNQLKALSNQLVDVHSQHQTLLLKTTFSSRSWMLLQNTRFFYYLNYNN